MGHVIALIALATSSVHSAPASWPMYRHDQSLTCRSEGSGGLTDPHLTWSYDLRGWEAALLVSAGEGTGRMSLSAPTEPVSLTAEQQQAFGLTAPLIDLRGDGNLVPAPPYAAKVLADVPGYQTPGTVMKDNERGWCVLYAYDQAERREVWRSEEFRVYQGPHPIVADANADGQLDVIACPHYQVVVMDGRTGEVIQQLRWHGGRNYGHFIAKNIDDDPALEFLVLADFYTHMDLIDNDGAELKLLWRKEIELKIESKQKILRPRWDSLQDLDDDGRFEVVTNLYNDTGDKQWHLMVYDALTGDAVLDLPGTFMTGLKDLDEDGYVELFCTDTEALFEPASSRLSIINLAGGEAVTRWSTPRGAWVTGKERYPLHINSNVAHADQSIVTEGRGFYVAEPVAQPVGQGSRLSRFELSPEGVVRRAWSLLAPGGSPQVLGHSDAGDALVSVRMGPADSEVAVRGCTAEAVSWTRTLPGRAQWGNLIAADLVDGAPLEVVAVTANSEVVALAPRGQGSPAELWRHTGAGTLAAADFDGDDLFEVACLGWEATGEGNATVIEGSGEVLWSRGIAGFPGPMEPWNFGTLTTLGVGRFSGGPQADLLVFSRRSTMHSDEGYALRGTDGELLWHRDGSFDGGTTWGFGGTPVATLDTDGDGCEDVVSLYPVNLTVVSGSDGEQLVGRTAANDSIFPGVWAAYASPTVFDYDADGSPELTWNGGYALGITDLAGETKWVTTPKADGFPCDADGDGQHEMVSPQGSTLRWLDPADGSVRWSLELPSVGSGVVVADVDGDGDEEALVACGKRLLAAGVTDGAASVVWEVEAPAEIAEFIVADLDGDGELEGVVYGGDGFLYGVEG